MCYFDALTLNVVVFAIAGAILGYTTRNLYRKIKADKNTDSQSGPQQDSHISNTQ
jgi:hypothetical protein